MSAALQQRGAILSSASCATHDVAARILRQCAKRNIPALLSEYWLITNERAGNTFPKEYSKSLKTAFVKQEGGRSNQLDKRRAEEPVTLTFAPGAKPGDNRVGILRTPEPSSS